MSEKGEIYTAGKNFTLPPAVTGGTNLTSAVRFALYWLCHFASLFHQQISISTILVQSLLIHMRLLIRNGVKVNCIFMKRARLALILALKWNPNYVHGLDYVSP